MISVFIILERRHDCEDERDSPDFETSATSSVGSSLEDVEDLTEDTPPPSKKAKGVCT